MNSVGHPFGPGPIAIISEKSPRANAWRTIFNGLTAPIKSAVPQRCEIARLVSLVYWLDIGRIDSEMMDRLVAHAQTQSAGAVSYEQVHEVLMAEGMPIKYEDVSTITNEHPETIIAGIEAEIAKATADIHDELDLHPTFEIERLMDPLRRKAEGNANHGSADNEFYATPQDIRHAALDAMFADIGRRMDAQAGIPAEMLTACEANPRATYDIPPGSSIDDTPIPPGRMIAQQIAEMIGGEVIDERTIRSPSLMMSNVNSTIVFEDEQGNLSELSSGDDLPPALCACIADGTPRGPHCIHARSWTFLDEENGRHRVRKHGGAHTCPRPCAECRDGAHHFCEIDMQPVFPLDDPDNDFDEEELEEVQSLRKHPAHLAGCESWCECRHCDAWMEASDNDDMDADDAPMNECEECGEVYAECDCDPDSDDYGPDSDDFDEDEKDDDCDDEEESSHNEPSPHPGSQDVSSMIPSNDAQHALFVMNDPPVRRSSVPRWASELARDLLHTARSLGLVAMRVPNNVQFQWALVITDWPKEVQASVHAWLNTPQESAQAAKDNVPVAVRALIDQANGTDGGEL